MIVMKTLKIIVSITLAFVIASSFYLSCYAYSHSTNPVLNDQNYIIDENIGINPVGYYTNYISLNTNTGYCIYGFSISPVPDNIPQAQVSIVHQIKISA